MLRISVIALVAVAAMFAEAGRWRPQGHAQPMGFGQPGHVGRGAAGAHPVARFPMPAHRAERVHPALGMPRPPGQPQVQPGQPRVHPLLGPRRGPQRPEVRAQYMGGGTYSDVYDTGNGWVQKHMKTHVYRGVVMDNRARFAQQSVDGINRLANDAVITRQFGDVFPETRIAAPGVIAQRKAPGVSMDQLAPSQQMAARNEIGRLFSIAKQRHPDLKLDFLPQNFRFDPRTGKATAWFDPIVPQP